MDFSTSNGTPVPSGNDTSGVSPVQPMGNVAASVQPNVPSSPAGANTQPPATGAPGPQPVNTQGAGNPTGPKAPAMPAPVQPQHPRSTAVNALLSLGQQLAGGPTRIVHVDDDGNRTVEYRPKSGRDIGLSILAHAIAGALAGSQAKGPNATAQAFGMGGAASMKLNEQAEAKTDEEAEAETQALLRKRQMIEALSRTALNTQQAEKYQRDGINTQIANDKYAVADAENDPNDILARDVVQDDYLKNFGVGKKYDPTETVAYATGMRPVQQPDGSTRLETTFEIVKNPDKMVTLTQDQIAKLNAQGMDIKLPAGATQIQISRRGLNAVTQMATAHALTDHELGNMRALLKDQPTMLNALPEKLDWTPGVALAVRQAQRYPGRDVAEQIAAMRQSRDPKAAGYAATLEQAFGGATVINAAHQTLLDQETARAEAAKENAKATADAAAKNPLTESQIKKNNAEAAKAEAERQKALHDLNDTELQTPGAFGDTTTLDRKTYNQTQRTFKKNADDLAKTNQSYAMFQAAANDARLALQGKKDISGAESVTTLFNAIGLSAAPLKGQGFRINNNTVEEHATARSLGESLYQKLLKLKSGDVITPQQILDYTQIASQARANQYREAINEARGQGLKPDFLMPRGNGRQIDPNTVQIYLDAANGNKDLARKAASANGWRF